MEGPSNAIEDLPDPDFFENTKVAIEKELATLKKIVNNVNQMRVEAAYLESDLILTIDASTWQEISDLIGSVPMKINEIINKEDPK